MSIYFTEVLFKKISNLKELDSRMIQKSYTASVFQIIMNTNMIRNSNLYPYTLIHTGYPTEIYTKQRFKRKIHWFFRIIQNNN